MLKRNSKGQFVKGYRASPKTEFRKGTTHLTSEETKSKIGKANSGKNNGMYGKVAWNTGTKGICKSNSKSFIKGQTAWNKGLGNGNRSEREIAMGTKKYRKWRRAVFKRDDFTCQICGKRGTKLTADHIKMWCLFPKLRYRIDNGQTLCKKCHIEKTRTEISIYWKNQYTISKAFQI